MRERLLDVRELDPPEPFEQALAALLDLGPDERLRLRIHREPFPLYALLRREGYRVETLPDAAGHFDILIARPPSS